MELSDKERIPRILKILILTNFFDGLYKFRRELVEKLARENELICGLPDDAKKSWFTEIGCKYIEVSMDNRGTNPVNDLRLFRIYRRIIRQVKPDVVLTYTIKPNIYGGIAAAREGIPYIANITGLGTGIVQNNLLSKAISFLYKKALKKATCTFFQNEENMKFFLEKKMVSGKYRLIPGSGVNKEDHRFEEYPEEKAVRFLFVGRFMKEKGIEEFLSAAESVKRIYPNTQFDVVGWLEEKEFEAVLKDYQERGIIQFHGPQTDVHSFIKNSHATVNPSYHEGMSNVLLESASTGRPVIASNIPGCRETFEDGVSGLAFEPRDAEDLADKLIKFIELPYEKKKAMGIAGRRKVEKEFDRNIVIDAYMEEIKKIREAIERR